MREEFGTTRPQALAALDETIRSSGLWEMIPGFKDAQKQLLLVLGELFPDETERDSAICRSYGVSNAAAVLDGWMPIASQVFSRNGL